MRKSILIVSLLLLSALLVANLFGQASKRKPRPQSKATKEAKSPCGIPIPTATEFDEELKVEWRDIGENPQASWYYNTRKQVCEKGILKVWIKSIQKDTTTPLAYSIDRIELNCRSNQSRLISTVKYRNDGSVFDSVSIRTPQWNDVIPESVGERILETLCRKTSSVTR